MELNVGMRAIRNWCCDGVEAILHVLHIYSLHIEHLCAVMLFAKGKRERPLALHFGATVENHIPRWNGCHPAGWKAHVGIEWMLHRASPQFSPHC